MRAADKFNRPLVVAHATTVTALGDLAKALAARLDVKDDRGDVEARTITIAVMAALAIAVGVIITAKVTTKANSINLDGP